MKSFDLEKALAGAPVITRDGRIVKELKVFETAADFQLFGTIGGDMRSWTKQGVACCAETNRDLFMIRNVKSGWVNLYINESCSMGVEIGEVYATRPDAACMQKKEGRVRIYITTARIEWEE